MSAPLQRLELVYAGLHRHEGQLLHLYYPINRRTGQLAEEPSVYTQPLGDFAVGSVLACQTPDDGATILPGVKLARTWADVEMVRQWLAQHEAISASEKAWSKPLPEDAFACAQPIREAYHRLDTEARTLLVVQLVRWISAED